MEFTRISLPAFSVIGKEGSTDDGPGFINALWDSANSAFTEVAQLAEYDENGAPRVWGLMSDMSMAFRPWENGFTRGRYLAGVQVSEDAAPPAGWAKWTSPAYEYIAASSEGPESFPKAIEYLEANGLTLAGAAYDLTVPGKGMYIYLPIKKL